MTSPCYDVQNKQDCPKRHAGCAATCPEWAEYEKERDKRYAKRRELSETDMACNAIHQVKINMWLQSRLRYPKRKR